MMRFSFVGLVLCVALFCSCDGHESMLPGSGGRPYEVLLLATGGNGAGVKAVDSVLTQDVLGLPQREPSFDVSVTDSTRFNATARLARNIVIVNINPRQFTRTMIRYEKNVWAHPQMVVYLNAATDSALTADIPRISRNLTDLLTRTEINTEISRLGDSGNPKAAELVSRMFGYSIRIPADMKSSKRGHDFLWFSDNAPSGMQNICVYSYAGDSLDPVRALAARDSVMKANIPGERDGMYMQTSDASVINRKAKEKGRIFMISRGLWEMHGDAMGGPFVAHSVADTATRRIIVAEAFVYAPEMKKRNLIRQVEAVLYTLKKNGKVRTADSTK